MSTSSPAISTISLKAVPVILLSGAVAGVLDISYVLIVFGLRGADPARILQGIARSVLGTATFDGGGRTAALGLTLHFCVALTVAAVFYALSRRHAFFVRQPWVWGPLYGTAVDLVMTFVVVPLTLIPRGPFPPPHFLLILVPHLVCVGLPIALIVRRLAPVRR